MDLEYINILTLKNYEKDMDISANFFNTIYIEKKLFDADMILGLETEEEAERQLKIDAPRCIFRYNGRRHSSIPKSIPKSLIPYCTQCVMGLPVTFLFKSFGIVSESGVPMVVNAYENESVIIFKKLIIKNFEGVNMFGVNVLVKIRKDEMVEISFRFDNNNVHVY